MFKFLRYIAYSTGTSTRSVQWFRSMHAGGVQYATFDTIDRTTSTACDGIKTDLYYPKRTDAICFAFFWIIKNEGDFISQYIRSAFNETPALAALNCAVAESLNNRL